MTLFNGANGSDRGFVMSVTSSGRGQDCKGTLLCQRSEICCAYLTLIFIFYPCSIDARQWRVGCDAPICSKECGTGLKGKQYQMITKKPVSGTLAKVQNEVGW
jgi:hypothetical protein